MTGSPEKLVPTVCKPVGVTHRYMAGYGNESVGVDWMPLRDTWDEAARDAVGVGIAEWDGVHVLKMKTDEEGVQIGTIKAISVDNRHVPRTEDETAEFADNGRNTGGKV